MDQNKGLFATDENQITLLYSSNTQLGKKANAMLQAAEKEILSIDIAKTKIGDSQWVEIASRLGKDLGDFINKENLEVDNTASFSTDDWLKVLQKNDALLAHPIAINGKRSRQLERETELLEFLEVDSAGLEKTPHTEPPNIDKKTNGENYI